MSSSTPRRKVEQRLLLYFDLLGFKELVLNNGAGRVRHVLSQMLAYVDDEAGKRSKKLGDIVDVIYFSDTILMYPKAAGFSVRAFHQLRLCANALYRALLQESLPISGAITYGSFVVESIGSRKEPVYFGQALIEAYEQEKKEKWIGVIVCPSITRQIPEEELGLNRDKGLWMIRNGDHDTGVLLLNPFLALKYAKERQVKDINGMETSERKALKALRYIHSEAERHALRGDFSSGVAVRYHATVAFAKAALDDECYRWAIRLPEKLKNRTRL